VSGVKLQVVGEDALMVYLGETVDERTCARVQAAVNAIEEALGDELIDLVPSYASVLVLYDPLRVDHVRIARRVRTVLQRLSDQALPEGRCVSLPVFYSPEAGADLEALAERANLSVEDVIALHAGIEYRVYAIGFAPGFAYLGQVDERIAAPRLATPRTRVPRGAVAIADRQTAVYPAASPGGWNLVGLCPVTLFDPRRDPPMPVAVGDRVRFEPVTRERFLTLGGELP
jgi:KipI family sensor histidine kinase inhibitor